MRSIFKNSFAFAFLLSNLGKLKDVFPPGSPLPYKTLALLTERHLLLLLSLFLSFFSPLELLMLLRCSRELHDDAKKSHGRTEGRGREGQLTLTSLSLSL